MVCFACAAVGQFLLGPEAPSFEQPGVMLGREITVGSDAEIIANPNTNLEIGGK